MHIVYMYPSYPISAKFINSKSVRSFSFSWPPPYFHHDAFTHHVQPVGLLDAGASIPPEAMMHFPLCFRFPHIFEKISESEENFQNVTFLVIDHKLRITPCFPCFGTFPP